MLVSHPKQQRVTHHPALCIHLTACLHEQCVYIILILKTKADAVAHPPAFWDGPLADKDFGAVLILEISYKY